MRRVQEESLTPSHPRQETQERGQSKQNRLVTCALHKCGFGQYLLPHIDPRDLKLNLWHHPVRKIVFLEGGPEENETDFDD